MVDRCGAGWREARDKLGIAVVAPFTFRVDGRAYECVAWLPDFGGPRGMVLFELSAPEFRVPAEAVADAEACGYRWSGVNGALYRQYNEAVFVEALRDWGFTGAASARPTWLQP